MSNNAKMSNLESYRELSLQITTLSMKLDKVLELLNKPEVEYRIESPTITVGADTNLNEVINTLNEHTRRAILNNETFDEEFK